MFRVVHALAVPPTSLRRKSQAPKLDFGSPPGTQPKKQGYGSYCIRAESALLDPARDAQVGTVRGYGDSIEIATAVKDACDHFAKWSHHAELTCNDASVVILTNRAETFLCEGVFLDFEDDVRRLV